MARVAPSVQLESVPDVSSPLQYLSTLDCILIKQDVEHLEVICGCETENRYQVLTTDGTLLFQAKEESGCCVRAYCGKNRPFDMFVRDLLGQVIIHMNRPLRCGTFLSPCFGLQKMNVFCPPGILVGSVNQCWNPCPRYNVRDATGKIVFKIKGPCCTSGCFCSVNFQVYSADGQTEVGRISKQWSGLLKEAFTDADNFGISFPVDLSVEMKVVLMGACFLIDYMYFENTNKKK